MIFFFSFSFWVNFELGFDAINVFQMVKREEIEGRIVSWGSDICILQKNVSNQLGSRQNVSFCVHFLSPLFLPESSFSGGYGNWFYIPTSFVFVLDFLFLGCFTRSVDFGKLFSLRLKFSLSKYV